MKFKIHVINDPWHKRKYTKRERKENSYMSSLTFGGHSSEPCTPELVDVNEKKEELSPRKESMNHSKHIPYPETPSRNLDSPGSLPSSTVLTSPRLPSPTLPPVIQVKPLINSPRPTTLSSHPILELTGTSQLSNTNFQCNASRKLPLRYGFSKDTLNPLPHQGEKASQAEHVHNIIHPSLSISPQHDNYNNNSNNNNNNNNTYITNSNKINNSYRSTGEHGLLNKYNGNYNNGTCGGCSSSNVISSVISSRGNNDGGGSSSSGDIDISFWDTITAGKAEDQAKKINTPTPFHELSSSMTYPLTSLPSSTSPLSCPATLFQPSSSPQVTKSGNRETEYHGEIHISDETGTRKQSSRHHHYHYHHHHHHPYRLSTSKEKDDRTHNDPSIKSPHLSKTRRNITIAMLVNEKKTDPKILDKKTLSHLDACFQNEFSKFGPSLNMVFKKTDV